VTVVQCIHPQDPADSGAALHQSEVGQCRNAKFRRRGFEVADLRPQSSANKEQRPTIWESKNFTYPASLGSLRFDKPTIRRTVPTRLKLLDRVSTRPQESEETVWPAHMSGAGDDEIRFTAAQIAFDLRDPVAVPDVDETPA
jgi:hypothetical protein